MVSLAQMTVAASPPTCCDLRHEQQCGDHARLAVVARARVRARARHLLAAAIGWLSVRTEGIYTIMITLAVGVAFFYLAQQNYTLFNGFQGFSRLAAPTVFGIDFTQPMAYYFLVLACALGGYWFVKHLIRAPFGIALQGIRDNPRRMQSVGFHVTRIASRVCGGGLSRGRGGVLMVWYNGRISPGTVGTGAMINILIIAVLGGMKHPIGAFIGAIVFVLLQNFAIDLSIANASISSSAGSSSRSSSFHPTAARSVAEAARPDVEHVHSTAAETAFIHPKQERDMSKQTRVFVRSLVGAAAMFAIGGYAQAQDVLKIGLLASLEGPFAAPGQDGMRGADLALKQHKGVAGGKKIEFVKVSSDACPDKAVDSTRKAVEQDKVQIMIGPLSGDEGIAVKNYAKTQPNVTFINGSSARRAPRWSIRRRTSTASTPRARSGCGPRRARPRQGLQEGLPGRRGLRLPVLAGAGFMASYCAKGGKVLDKAWVPLGTKDYASVIAKIPKNIDALVVVLGGSDAVNFLTSTSRRAATSRWSAARSTVDQTVLNFKGKRRESLLGTASAGPMADSIDTPEWKAFVADYKATFKDGFPSRRCSRTCTTSTPRRRSMRSTPSRATCRTARRPIAPRCRRPTSRARGRGQDRCEPQRRGHDLHHRSREGGGRFVLQQGREVGAQHLADARPVGRRVSRRWASGRATCPIAATKAKRAATMASITSLRTAAARHAPGAGASAAGSGQLLSGDALALTGVTRAFVRCARSTT